jgi:hypothetical protein
MPELPWRVRGGDAGSGCDLTRRHIPAQASKPARPERGIRQRVPDRQGHILVASGPQPHPKATSPRFPSQAEGDRFWALGGGGPVAPKGLVAGSRSKRVQGSRERLLGCSSRRPASPFRALKVKAGRAEGPRLSTRISRLQASSPVASRCSDDSRGDGSDQLSASTAYSAPSAPSQISLADSLLRNPFGTLLR